MNHTIPALGDDSCSALHRFYFPILNIINRINKLIFMFSHWMDSNQKTVKFEALNCGSQLSIGAQGNICMIVGFFYQQWISAPFLKTDRGLPSVLTKMPALPLCVCTWCVFTWVSVCPGLQRTRWNPLLSSAISISTQMEKRASVLFIFFLQ